MSSSRTNAGRAERLALPELVAMGVGAMIGGGIFSVLGLAMATAGHAAPIAFAAGGLIALLTGLSYAKLGLAYRDDGGSFTYLEHAFRHHTIAGIAGWLLIAGYVGTLSLYASTFGAYGAALLTRGASAPVFLHHVLSSAVVLIFLGVNLYGVAATGRTEEVIVAVKVALLSFFAVAGLLHLDASRVLPLFNLGPGAMLIGAAVVFVAFEGFELIPNAINETENPQRNLPASIIFSILLVTAIYFLVSLVAVGFLTPDQVRKYEEYALAEAAKPFLGQLGFLIIVLGALLSTASAINATLFGTARLARAMALDEVLPRAFSFRERTKDVPYVGLIVISAAALALTNLGGLSLIASFASATFLGIFAAVNLAGLALHRRIGLFPLFPIAGFIGAIASLALLLSHLATDDPRTFWFVIAAAVVVSLAEIAFSKRALIRLGRRKVTRA